MPFGSIDAGRRRFHLSNFDKSRYGMGGMRE